MINRMLMYTVSTGLVTSVLSCFILVVVHLRNLAFFGNAAELIVATVCQIRVPY
jgi:hypothetical protein